MASHKKLMQNEIYITNTLFNLAVFADYSMHSDAQEIIDELVYRHGFENMLFQFFKGKKATKNNRINFKASRIHLDVG